MERRVGLDLGLRTHHQAVVYDGATERGRPFAVEVGREGFEELLRRATAGVDGPVTFVMEPTGLAWVPLSAYLMAAGHRVNLVTPQKASDLRKFFKKHVKSDVADARSNAQLPAIDPGGVRELQLPSAEQMSLRRLVKRRDRLVGDSADTKRRVHALMQMVNPALLDALGEDKFGRAAVAFYRTFADPEVVVRRGPAALKRFWRKHSRGQASQERADKVFEACKKTADLYRDLRSSGKLPFDYIQVQDELGAEMERMEQTDREVARLEVQIDELYSRIDPQRTLEQLRGVSSTIAPALEALIGDITRFANGRRFVSYCGLAPRLKKSGLSDASMPISKAGQRLLKKYLYLAADVARQWDPDFAAYYARRYAAGDQHNRILIALARKMALRVHALLKRRERARRSSQADVAMQGYILRDGEGLELDRKQARQLIIDRYARAVVAPQRNARDRAQHGKGGERRSRNRVAVESTPQAKNGASGHGKN
jgi:transposase